MRLTEHFLLTELTRSDAARAHGIRNEPARQEIYALLQLAKHILEPLRILLDAPVVVTSGYRSQDLNRIVSRSPNSQHVKGEAADIVVEGFSPQEVFDTIRSNLPFDQLIQEYSDWVHVSYTERYPLRYDARYAVKVGDETEYIPAEEYEREI